MTESLTPDQERMASRQDGNYEVPIVSEAAAGSDSPKARRTPSNRATGFSTGPDEAERILNAARIDLAEVQRQFERNLDDLLQRWTDITARQRDQIVDQVRSAVTSDDLAALARISVSTSDAAQALTEAMTDMALTAAQEMSREASRQGVPIDPVASDSSVFASVAAAMAALLAEGLTNSAGREALRQ